MKTCVGECCIEALENLVYDEQFNKWMLIIDTRGAIVYYCPYCGKKLV